MHISNIRNESLPPKHKGRWDYQACGTLVFAHTLDGETWQRWTPSREFVKAHLRLHVHNFSRERQEEGNWYDYYLDSLEEVEHGKWEYCILQAWLD